MSLDPAVAAVRTPWGARRFHPPGQHPAARHAAAVLADAERIRGNVVRDGRDPAEIDRLIEHLRDELAVFEEGESIAKANYYARSRRSR